MEIKKSLGLSGLTPLVYEKKQRNSHVVLAILPAWQTIFPPYGLARLTGVARASGYTVSVFDINLAATKYLAGNKMLPDWNTNDNSNFASHYWTKTHPVLEPFLNEYIDKIVLLNPAVVGFTLYWSNELPTYWMAEQIKLRLPLTKVIVGGPSTHSIYYEAPAFIDHWISGDGEQSFLNLLENLEENKPTARHLSPVGKLDINSFPMPVYSDFDLAGYDDVGTFPAELSRGCVARCTFCASTTHWKYRSRKGKNISEEIKYLTEKYSATCIGFVDHLLNGNLIELQEFAEDLIASDIHIKWLGFARCNGEMNPDYLNMLSKAGLHSFSFGIESGSQKVLDLISKQVTVPEIDQNMIDTKKANIEIVALWIVGFPNEDPEAFADTLALQWRRRSAFDVLIFSPCSIDPGSNLERKPEKFSVNLNYATQFLNDWHTENLQNTNLHRVLRCKLMQIFFLELAKFGCTAKQVRPTELAGSDYSITYQTDILNDEIPAEIFDYDILQPGINAVADSLVNECWSLFRTLWRAVGAFEIVLNITPRDCTTYTHVESDFYATQSFKIDSGGNWQSEIKQSFRQKKNQGPVDYSYKYDGSASGKWSRNLSQKIGSQEVDL